MLTQALQEIREARLLFGVANHKGLLRLPDPAGGVAFDGRLAASGLFARDAGFKDVEAHDVACGIVKYEGEEVELNDGVQALGKVMEQGAKIALLGDGLA